MSQAIHFYTASPNLVDLSVPRNIESIRRSQLEVAIHVKGFRSFLRLPLPLALVCSMKLRTWVKEVCCGAQGPTAVNEIPERSRVDLQHNSELSAQEASNHLLRQSIGKILVLTSTIFTASQSVAEDLFGWKYTVKGWFGLFLISSLFSISLAKILDAHVSYCVSLWCAE